MPTFLAQLAEKVVEKKQVPLEQTVVVLPNKRAKRQLLSALAKHFMKPVFIPNILSVNEFIYSLSSLNKIDNDELVVRLFKLYKKKNSAINEDFTAFLSWAPIFLQDINEIDLHLADATTIFSNLSEIKTLETSFGKENLTDNQKKYLQFYQQLADLYIDFTSALRADRVGYEGMIYKDAANHLQAKEARYVFAGLNAATPSEVRILEYFYTQKNAEIYFDIDEFYAAKYGVFIEEIRQELNITEIQKSNDYKEISKKISCIGAPKRIAQVQTAVDVLNKIENEQGSLNETVLVFADETMLLPFVHEYNSEKANITMGYPLRATIAAQQLQQYIDEEKQSNRLLKPAFDLKKQGFEFLQFLQSKFHIANPKTISAEVENNYQQMKKVLEDASAFLLKFFTNENTLDFSIVEYFLQSKINATAIPFAGSAQEGLQIMGLLETRLLDFKNVIVLSMNEGVLPKGKIAPSLLLYDIKKHFGLPTHQRSDAITGYHFFRMLQRAENVFLIYDNESANSLTEKSRFIAQLEFEVKKQNLHSSIQISNHQYKVPFSFPEKRNISIPKTNEIIEKLKQFKFSPSSLCCYIQCPLQFYWKYIEGIVSSKLFDENNESAIVGNIIHKVLEEIFTKIKQKNATFSSILSEYEKNIDEVLLRVFSAQPEIGDAELEHGKLFLACQIVKKTILDYITVLKKEWQHSVPQIIGTEISLRVDVDCEEHKLCFTGNVDRVEMRENKVTILDYKTGKVLENKLKCKEREIETVFSHPEYFQLFQLLSYAYLYFYSQNGSIVPTTEVQCGVVAFQELYKQNDTYIHYAEIDKEKILRKETMQIFQEHLKQLFLTILDKKIAFSQTEDESNCEYCEYKSI